VDDLSSRSSSPAACASSQSAAPLCRLSLLLLSLFDDGSSRGSCSVPPSSTRRCGNEHNVHTISKTNVCIPCAVFGTVPRTFVVPRKIFWSSLLPQEMTEVLMMMWMTSAARLTKLPAVSSTRPAILDVAVVRFDFVDEEEGPFSWWSEDLVL